MKLTILGSGTVVPSGERNSAGFFVELPDARLMIDAGAGSVHALARFNLPWQQISHLFISHFHVDHAGELAHLFFAFRYGMKYERAEPLTLIAPDGINRVMDGLKLAFGDRLFDPKFPVNVRVLVPGDAVRLGPLSTLSVTKTPHTRESLAVRIESEGRALCYTGDTAYSDDVSDFFQDADLLISECSLLEPRGDARHLSVSEVARLATRARAAKLILTHFYFDVDEESLIAELERGYGGEVIIGRDGLTLELG